MEAHSKKSNQLCLEFFRTRLFAFSFFVNGVYMHRRGRVSLFMLGKEEAVVILIDMRSNLREGGFQYVTDNRYQRICSRLRV